MHKFRTILFAHTNTYENKQTNATPKIMAMAMAPAQCVVRYVVINLIQLGGMSGLFTQYLCTADLLRARNILHILVGFVLCSSALVWTRAIVFACYHFIRIFFIYYCFHSMKLCSLNDSRARYVKSVGINVPVQVMHCICLKLFRTSNGTWWALSGNKNGFLRVIVIGANGLCSPHCAE